MKPYVLSALFVVFCVIFNLLTHQPVYLGLAIVIAGAAATLAWVRYITDNKNKN